MLKQQLQKTEEELAARFIQRLADNLQIPDTRIVEHGSLYQDLQVFIRQEQIDAVKAFAEEIRPELLDIGDNTRCKNCGEHVASGDCDCGGMNKAFQEINNKINNLLKDI